MEMVSTVPIIPIDLIKHMVELEPILVGKIVKLNQALRGYYSPMINEFKLKLLRPVIKVYSKHFVLPNGAKHSLFTKYYGDKIHVKSTVNYIDGLKQGEKRNYTVHNNLHSIVNYVDGKKHGSSIIYNSNGMICEIKNYHLGKLHGTVIGYYNGRVSNVKHYLNGKLNGKIFLPCYRTAAHWIFYQRALRQKNQ